MAVEAMSYRSVDLQFCVVSASSKGYQIRVAGHSKLAGSTGFMTSKYQLQVGGCFSGMAMLEPSTRFSRDTFLGRLEGRARLLRSNTIHAFAMQFVGDSQNLVAGLAIGEASELNQGFLNEMKSTGLTHLTAVSGANCVMVLGMLWFLLRRTSAGRGTRTFVGLVAMVGYVSLVGFQPSVLRASFMVGVALIAVEFGRKISPLWALMLAASLLLIMDPWLVVDLGFWLSTLATLGIVSLVPLLNSSFEAYFPRSIALALSATIAAQIWCLPILVYLQGGFTTYSVLANLLVEPAVAVVTILGLLGCLIGGLLPGIGMIFIVIASYPAQWIIFVAHKLANQSGNLLWLPTDTLGLFALAIFVVSLTVWMRRKHFMALAIAMFLVVLWIGHSLLSLVGWPIAEWSVASCDVGQGDATVVRSKGEIALIDVGKDERLISECLDRLNVRTINLLVLTHFDFDHVGALDAAIRGRKVVRALISGFPDNRPEADHIRQVLHHFAGSLEVGTQGEVGSLGSASWRIFSALGDTATTANEGSLGIRFESDNWVLWTLADLNALAQEQALQECSPSAKLTIVKVSHHGSADQDPRFYACIKPDLALISVGLGNSYGHPTERLLKILSDLRVSTLRTDQVGSISLALTSHGIKTLSHPR